MKLKALTIVFCWLMTAPSNSFCQTVENIVSSAKRITNVSDSYPMASPDGKKIAFESNRTGDWEIFVMNFDGTELKQLTHSKGFDGCPIWSPDGTKIVFPSERDNDSEIYIMNADGTN